MQWEAICRFTGKGVALSDWFPSIRTWRTGWREWKQDQREGALLRDLLSPGLGDSQSRETKEAPGFALTAAGTSDLRISGGGAPRCSQDWEPLIWELQNGSLGQEGSSEAEEERLGGRMNCISEWGEETPSSLVTALALQVGGVIHSFTERTLTGGLAPTCGREVSTFSPKLPLVQGSFALVSCVCFLGFCPHHPSSGTTTSSAA